MIYTTLTVKDKDYKLRLDAKSCVDLEKRLGTNPLNIYMAISSKNELPTLTSLIYTLHASLTAMQHSITLEDAYNIYNDYVDEGHTMVDLIPVILDVFKVSGFFKEEVESKN